MRFQTSDPDIATIFRRIERKVIDLQPEFQRGEVWTTPKKQRLIDTILRKWHVPPIHLVSKGEGKFDVLDGQQRLTSIRDFMQGSFPVDATIEPIVPGFEAYDGLRYGQLPEGLRDEFESFAIRIFELHDYTPEEPHELFFRLNQPMTLTEAEKRNAFIGPARNQVKELVEWAKPLGMNPDSLGFSNARMAYDDLISRFLLVLEQGTLTEKVTALRITTRYRKHEPFKEETILRARTALNFYLNLPIHEQPVNLKPNKATIHTWLCMAAKLAKEGLLDSCGEYLAKTVQEVESWRVQRTRDIDATSAIPRAIFHDRATSRVADVSSVVLRDMTGSMVLTELLGPHFPTPDFMEPAERAWGQVAGNQSPERTLASYCTEVGWGAQGWL
ncbi:DUF262 domain-containing protein [Actinomadura sp. KC345]|uniref:DUF262 domain-containing protein n=1 Tax=Actinomadura sp. KC345 TaxID=2530371 RepID=UPI00104FC66A|nr:DUF262 domain-containing protein [Actinomadura sp. KC345]TDC54828.1 DUF262 domain-containing protein [Actinomadura sp. KC345]